MGGATKTTSQNLCEVEDSADKLDINISTSGDCNSHCDFKPKQTNSVTIKLEIKTEEIVSYFFTVVLEFDTNHSEVLSDNLPECDKIDFNDSETYSVEVFQKGGPVGRLETLEFDVKATTHDDHCEEADNDDNLSLDVDINPQLEFV